MTAAFTSPPDPESFDAQVWAVVRLIPAGRVGTYGQIAAMIPPPPGVSLAAYLAHGARWVGGAMARCPQDVPWHRVINAQGKISQRKSGSHQRQRERLLAEGIDFDDRGRIDLDRFGWSGA